MRKYEVRYGVAALSPETIAELRAAGIGEAVMKVGRMDAVRFISDRGSRSSRCGRSLLGADDHDQPRYEL